MSNQFETSFIPQQPILKVEGVSRSSEPVNLALILALIVFFVTIAVAGGVYFYRHQIDGRVLAKEKELQAAEKDFNIDEITTYKRIDSRLTLAKKLVDEHVISSAAFELLEASTAQNIGLTTLSFSKDPAGNNTIIDLSGQAPSYAAVYFQAESWRAMRPKIKNVEVTGMTLSEQSGIVSFTIKLMIDPQYFESLRVIEARSAASPISTTPKVPASPSVNISTP